MTIFSQVTWDVQAGVGFPPVAPAFEAAPVFEVAPGAPEVAAVVLETAPGTVAPVIALLEVAAPEVEHEFAAEIVTPAFEAAAAPG